MDDTSEHKRRKFDANERFNPQFKNVYPCDQCEYAATSQGSLNRHKQSIHYGIRYPCDQCEYAATENGALKKHKQSIHEGIRYPCDQCEYTATESGLKKHKKSIHEGIRYPCDQCEYVSTRHSSLKRHRLSKHAVIRNVRIEKLDYSEHLRTQNKVNIEEHLLIETSQIDLADPGIKRKDVTEENPLTDTHTPIDLDPLEIVEAVLKKERIEKDERLSAKEDIEEDYCGKHT